MSKDQFINLADCTDYRQALQARAPWFVHGAAILLGLLLAAALAWAQLTKADLAPDSQRPDGQQAVIYVVKVALEETELGRGDLRGQVKLGMTGQAEIVTGQASILALLVKQIRQTISLG